MKHILGTERRYTDVASSRRRGLKHLLSDIYNGISCRLFTEAWIETEPVPGGAGRLGRLFTEAWIETQVHDIILHHL